jgi:hypothetical protein
MNLGALFKLAKSNIYNPFRLARHTSLLLGDIDRLPTGWFTLIVAPSRNGSGGLGSCRLSALTVCDVPERSNLGRNNDRGDSSGGGSRWKLEVVEVTDEERRLPGDKGEVGRGISLGENIMTLLV